MVFYSYSKVNRDRIKRVLQVEEKYWLVRKVISFEMKHDF